LNTDFYEKSLSPVGRLLVFFATPSDLCLSVFIRGFRSWKVFSVYPMNLPSKQTGLAFAVLLFFMDDFVFLVFIMAQPDGQMLSM
jgi:hypothetical protein